MLTKLINDIEQNKIELDRLRSLVPKGLHNFEHCSDLELTYTSNAIEGNTLSAAETTLVIEQGITIGGKPLKDHLEAIDHYDALRYVRTLAQQTTIFTEIDVRTLHGLIVKRSDPDIAGRYADQGRYVLTDNGRYIFPAPIAVPALMGDFAAWLRDIAHTPAAAFTAHRRLVEIHPFNDGNGRTARLLMNLILIRGGYSPVAIRPVDRLTYIHALQESQLGHGHAAFDLFLCERLAATVGEYLDAVHAALQQVGGIEHLQTAP